MWIDLAPRFRAHVLPAEQGRHVRDDATIRDHHQPADPLLVHLPSILQVQANRKGLLRRLLDHGAKDLQHNIPRKLGTVHPILHYHTLLHIRCAKDREYLHH